MDYEKKYKEALERARQFSETPCLEDSAGIVEYIFPELTEDERIRQTLIKYHKATIDIDYIKGEKIIAWLEKQGEQNLAIEMKSPEESLGIDSDTYNKIVDECIYGEQKPQRTVSAEAKEAMYSKPAWSEEDELHIRELESLVKKEWAIAERENDKDKIHKMSDLSFFLKTLKPQPKQEWGDEDNKIIEEIINDIECARAINYHAPKEGYEFRENWLKSLKPQNTWKPSDEQMDALETSVSYYQSTALESLYNDLKRVKEGGER